MGTGVFGSDNLSFDASMTETRTDDYPLEAIQFLSHILLGNILTIHKVQLRLYVVVDTRQIEALTDALVGILQVVLAH